MPVAITRAWSAIEIVVEGEMPDDSAIHLAEEMRANAERVAECPCVLEQP